MKINSFTATGVNGYLNYDIRFLPDITFLIGINGSGKTTALKLILGLISPSYQLLNNTPFVSAKLVCSSNAEEEDIVISALQRNPDVFDLSLTVKERKPVSQPIRRFRRSDAEGMDADDFSILEHQTREEFDSFEVTKAIRDVATPRYLGLDRRIYEGRAYDAIRNRRMHTQKRLKKSADSQSALDTSLEEVQYFVFDYIRRIAYKQPAISEAFKKRVFSVAFDYIDEGSLSMIPDDSSEIKSKSEMVIKAIKDLDLGYLEYKVNDFFAKMVNIIEKNAENKPVEGEDPKITSQRVALMTRWFNNATQLKRIDEIIKYSKQYQASLAELRTPIEKFEEITSKFFEAGEKKIKIEADGEMKVILPSGRKDSIFELSSGERQIVIMIAHLIFEEEQKTSGILIIDEPELSLHISWQEIFVDSIMAASPKTQFILATHSPSIVAKVEREAFCRDLSKLTK